MTFSLQKPDDLYLFNAGRHTRLYQSLGAHVATVEGVAGVNFATWAPAARSVSVFGQFSGWSKSQHQMASLGESGIWELFIPDIPHGAAYKFHIVGPDGVGFDKADPFATYAETPPETASRVWDLDFDWDDAEWMQGRAAAIAHNAPVAIYEMHIGSWKRVPEEGNRPMTYRELAETLPAHLNELAFTHVELLPITEHPYGPSWGYQTTGYFAPTARFGTPQDLMFLIDSLHKAGVGVILDWVPSHFPVDDHGLGRYDGTHLFEHADPRQGFHPDWGSAIFNYGRHEVRSFLTSSALAWLDRYHIDGLRVDAVASMLYLDYSREEGEWIPNQQGGNENLDAVQFLQELNTAVYGAFPDVQMFAEESTAWPGVTKPAHDGGLGFGFKWDMGWMHDTLAYLGRDSIHRKYHHQELTFRSLYANTENYTLALSHDEVVHGKRSLLLRMTGDEWQRFANLRLLYTYMYTTPGKKLLFMGSEMAQVAEWDHNSSIEWHLLDHPPHRGVFDALRALGVLYTTTPELHRGDHDPSGFQWISADDADHSILSFLRRDPETGRTAAVILNFTPTPHTGYSVSVPDAGEWTEVFNSDAAEFGGSGMGNAGALETVDGTGAHAGLHIVVDLPPLAGVVFRGPGG